MGKAEDYLARLVYPAEAYAVLSAAVCFLHICASIFDNQHVSVRSVIDFDGFIYS